MLHHPLAVLLRCVSGADSHLDVQADGFGRTGGLGRPGGSGRAGGLGRPGGSGHVDSALKALHLMPYPVQRPVQVFPYIPCQGL